MNTKLLKTLLDYDPCTGLFTWKKSSSSKPIIGTVAGTLHPHGYTRININKKMYYAHRLAWLYVHGKWPPAEIDHKDCDPANNRISNLRLATHAQNAANAHLRRTSTSGLKGAYRHQKKWLAQITYNGRRIYLGVFDTDKEAHAAYVAASKDLHGSFTRL